MPRKTAVAAAEPPRRGPGRPRKATTQSVQSAVEGVLVEDEDKVEFKGENFMMAKSIGLMPLLKFAHAQQQGLDTDNMAGLAAMYELIGDCIEQTKPMEEKKNPQTGKMEMLPAGPSEWERFVQHSIAVKADAEDLMQLVQTVIERVAARPSKRPGNSSAGPETTSQNLKDSSSRTGIEYPGLTGMMSVEDLRDMEG